MLSINISETIWTVINFFLLLFVLKRFLFDPILKVMDAREAKISAGTEAAQKAQAALEENARSLDEQKLSAEREAASLLSESAETDSRRTGEAYAKAREDADALQKQGEERLQELRAEEKAALDAKTPELAALLAAQLLGEEE